MISIKNLTKEFSGQKVLDGIDIDIEKGEVVALVGASGAGKSTILRSLNYLEQPDSGTITIDDFQPNDQCTQSRLRLPSIQGRLRYNVQSNGSRHHPRFEPVHTFRRYQH